MKSHKYLTIFLLLAVAACTQATKTDFDFFNPSPTLAEIVHKLKIAQPPGSVLSRSLSSQSAYSGEDYKMSVYSRQLPSVGTQELAIFIEKKHAYNTKKKLVVTRTAADYANIELSEKFNGNMCGGNSRVEQIFTGEQHGFDTYVFASYCGKNEKTGKGAITLTKVISGNEAFYKIIDLISAPLFDVHSLPGDLEKVVKEEMFYIENIGLVGN